MNGPFIAVDWGTTNRRAYRIENGRAAQTERDGRGILALQRDDFAHEAAGLRARLGDLPLLCVGMVGSRSGWREVPYVATPAGLTQLALGTVWVERGVVAITPGLKYVARDRCDVMRGEEVQFLGAVSAGVAPEERLLCQPGTHSKWARVVAARIQDFSTSMTGELYSLLRRHSLLAQMLEGEAVIGTAFYDGVREGRKRTLLSSLFGARAAQLLNVRPAAEGPSFISGLLIGSDVESQVCSVDQEVFVIGDAPLGPLYAAAIESLGNRPHLIASAAAFIAGVSKIWELLI
jgi:2-dehydro-3-deoxygalactonokinase